jgi:hypothetical protein
MDQNATLSFMENEMFSECNFTNMLNKIKTLNEKQLFPYFSDHIFIIFIIKCIFIYRRENFLTSGFIESELHIIPNYKNKLEMIDNYNKLLFVDHFKLSDKSNVIKRLVEILEDIGENIDTNEDLDLMDIDDVSKAIILSRTKKVNVMISAEILNSIWFGLHSKDDKSRSELTFHICNSEYCTNTSHLSNCNQCLITHKRYECLSHFIREDENSGGSKKINERASINTSNIGFEYQNNILSDTSGRIKQFDANYGIKKYRIEPSDLLVNGSDNDYSYLNKWNEFIESQHLFIWKFYHESVTVDEMFSYYIDTRNFVENYITDINSLKIQNCLLDRIAKKSLGENMSKKVKNLKSKLVINSEQLKTISRVKKPNSTRIGRSYTTSRVSIEKKVINEHYHKDKHSMLMIILDDLETLKNHRKVYGLSLKKLKTHNNPGYLFYLSFLDGPNFTEMMANEQSVDEYHKDVFNFVNSPHNHRDHIKNICKIIKLLTPGIIRLYIEIDRNISDKCVEKFKLAESLVDKCAKEKKILDVNLLHKDDLLRFDYRNYDLILDKTLSKIEYLEIALFVYRFFVVCKRCCSDNKKLSSKIEKSLEKLVIGVLFAMEDGLTYNDRTIIPQNPKFQKGFLLTNNKLQSYHIKRDSNKQGKKLINTILEYVCMSMHAGDLQDLLGL